MLRRLGALSKTVTSVTQASLIRPAARFALPTFVSLNSTPIRNSQRFMSDADSTASSDSPRRMKVYTKTGDAGTSTLYNMQRISKASDYFETLGDVDELNAHLGFARHYSVAEDNGLAPWLEELQSRLLDAGGCIATPLTSSPESRVHRTKFPEDATETLERWIDQMDAELPPLTQFILPSGGLASSSLHVCRTVCRRAERRTVPLVQRGDLELYVSKFFNRLSDFFFVAARYSAMKSGVEEVKYKRHVERFHSQLRRPAADAATDAPVDAAADAAAAAEKPAEQTPEKQA